MSSTAEYNPSQSIKRTGRAIGSGVLVWFGVPSALRKYRWRKRGTEYAAASAGSVIASNLACRARDTEAMWALFRTLNFSRSAASSWTASVVEAFNYHKKRYMSVSSVCFRRNKDALAQSRVLHYVHHTFPSFTSFANTSLNSLIGIFRNSARYTP